MTIQLEEDSSAPGLIVNIGQDVHRLLKAASFGDRLSEFGWTITHLQRPHNAMGLHCTEFSRAGKP
jgi:hypothetical protein